MNNRKILCFHGFNSNGNMLKSKLDIGEFKNIFDIELVCLDGPNALPHNKYCWWFHDITNPINIESEMANDDVCLIMHIYSQFTALLF